MFVQNKQEDKMCNFYVIQPSNFTQVGHHQLEAVMWNLLLKNRNNRNINTIIQDKEDM